MFKDRYRSLNQSYAIIICRYLENRISYIQGNIFVQFVLQYVAIILTRLTVNFIWSPHYTLESCFPITFLFDRFIRITSYHRVYESWMLQLQNGSYRLFSHLVRKCRSTYGELF